MIVNANFLHDVELCIKNMAYDRIYSDKEDGTWVTLSDLHIQKCVSNCIQKWYGANSQIYAEESIKNVLELTSNDLWIMDPIDGTSNFVKSIPLYSFSLAHSNYGILDFGMLYDFSNKMLYIADDSSSIKDAIVHKAEKMEDAILAINYPKPLEHRKKHTRFMTYLNSTCRTIRILGSTALTLLYVSQGKLDGCLLSDCKPWDIAASLYYCEKLNVSVLNKQGNKATIKDNVIIASHSNNILEELYCIYSDMTSIRKHMYVIK